MDAMTNTTLWWKFREQRNKAQENYKKTGDLNYLHTVKQMQDLMDGCFKEIVNNN